MFKLALETSNSSSHTYMVQTDLTKYDTKLVYF